MRSRRMSANLQVISSGMTSGERAHAPQAALEGSEPTRRLRR